MTSTPISQAALIDIVAQDLAKCSDEVRAYYGRVAVPAAKWTQHSYGEKGAGFWVVAVEGDCVLWYNDIEEGFNVSKFREWGVIPDDEYWCNQDELESALNRLRARR